MDSKQTLDTPLLVNQNAEGQEPSAVAVAEVIGMPSVRVQVQAPFDLQAGYQLTVDINGQAAVVAVPDGGVLAGETFQASFVTTADGSGNIPVGAWRDGIFSCCTLGCCHPSCCTAYWCPSLALGQVMTRMNLDWTGAPVPTDRRAAGWSPLKVMVALAAAYYAMHVLVDSIIQVAMVPPLETDTGTEAPPDLPVWAIVLVAFRGLLAIAYSVYVLFALVRTRMYIRNKYKIRREQNYCCGADDCCVSFWCGCCTVSQMYRHTADYDVYSAVCCTETGLSPHIV